jgi:hypothetical protein
VAVPVSVGVVAPARAVLAWPVADAVPVSVVDAAPDTLDAVDACPVAEAVPVDVDDLPPAVTVDA